MEKKRKVEFITPPNTLKLKIGTGGLAATVIEKAQKVIDEQTGDDFVAVAQRYLASFHEGIRLCETRKDSVDIETLITTLSYPAVQLKANGSMFNYPLITIVGTKLVNILEIVAVINQSFIELMDGFLTVLRAILAGKMRGDGAGAADDLLNALDQAIQRYVEKDHLAD